MFVLSKTFILIAKVCSIGTVFISNMIKRGKGFIFKLYVQQEIFFLNNRLVLPFPRLYKNGYTDLMD